MAELEPNQFREALSVCAAEIIQLKETLAALGEHAIRQDAATVAMGKLIVAQNERIQMQQVLIDNHHDVLIKAGLAEPRPAKDPLVN